MTKRYNPNKFNINSFGANARVARNSSRMSPQMRTAGIPYGVHSSKQQYLNNFLNFMGSNVGGIEPPEIPVSSLPKMPGIEQTNFVPAPPPTGNQTQLLNENTGSVLKTTSSNLVSCPVVESQSTPAIPLGCWLFSSDNDRFARKNLETDVLVGEKEPQEISTVQANWIDLQCNNGRSGGNFFTEVTQDLYNSEILQSEQRIFTGLMVNSNTGEIFETYEDDVPPPNTDKPRLLPEQMSFQNPKVTALSGGYDPSMPPRQKVEVLENDNDYGPDAGRNIWGPQLYATAIRDLSEQKDVIQQFNNRDGMVPVEPAWDRRAVGFVGHVSAYRGTPFMPPTQREASENPNTFGKMVSVDLKEIMDYHAPPNLQLGGKGGIRDYSDTFGGDNGVRESVAVIRNGSVGVVNQVPGRVSFKEAENGDVSRNKKPGRPGSQIYVDGEVSLKKELPDEMRHQFMNTPDATIINSSILTTRGERNTLFKQDSSDTKQRYGHHEIPLEIARSGPTPKKRCVSRIDGSENTNTVALPSVTVPSSIRAPSLARRVVKFDKSSFHSSSTTPGPEFTASSEIVRRATQDPHRWDQSIENSQKTVQKSDYFSDGATPHKLPQSVQNPVRIDTSMERQPITAAVPTNIASTGSSNYSVDKSVQPPIKLDKDMSKMHTITQTQCGSAAYALQKASNDPNKHDMSQQWTIVTRPLENSMATSGSVAYNLDVARATPSKQDSGNQNVPITGVGQTSGSVAYNLDIARATPSKQDTSNQNVLVTGAGQTSLSSTGSSTYALDKTARSVSRSDTNPDVSYNNLPSTLDVDGSLYNQISFLNSFRIARDKSKASGKTNLARMSASSAVINNNDPLIKLQQSWQLRKENLDLLQQHTNAPSAPEIGDVVVQRVRPHNGTPARDRSTQLSQAERRRITQLEGDFRTGITQSGVDYSSRNQRGKSETYRPAAGTYNSDNNMEFALTSVEPLRGNRPISREMKIIHGIATKGFANH